MYFRKIAFLETFYQKAYFICYENERLQQGIVFEQFDTNVWCKWPTENILQQY